MPKKRMPLLLEGEEGESLASPHRGDILDMKLPESQLNLLRKISKKAKAAGKKVITVICSGMPLDMREVEELSDAVLYAWYPGERGGDAVADIIFGDVSPSGKLPITFPKSIDQLPAYDDYSMKGRTYKYMIQAPLYPFGYGMSYAKLTMENAKASTLKIKKEQSVEISVDIKNNSSFNVEEVAQLYLTIDNVKEQLPIASLINFKRIAVNKGGITTVSFKVPYNEFSYINSLGEKIQHKGKATLTLANAAPGQRSIELGANSVKFDIVVK